MIFAPTIITTIFAILTHFSVHIDIGMGKTLEFNYAMVFVLLLTVLYLYIDIISGVNSYESNSLIFYSSLRAHSSLDQRY